MTRRAWRGFVKDGEATWRPAFDDGRAWRGKGTREFFRVTSTRLQYRLPENTEWSTREDGRLYVGSGPWTPYREEVETRDMSPEVRRWMVEHPGKALIDTEGRQIWWNDVLYQFRCTRTFYWGESPANDDAWQQLRPVAGTWEDPR
jgi:hypothetical protein